MSLFSKKNNNTDPGRKTRLSDNNGQPFSTVIAGHKPGEKLERFCEKETCRITGNTEGLETGAVLQVRRDGILATILGKDIAQLDNPKRRQQINDYFDKSGVYSSIDARFVAAEGDRLYCNLGFYVSE